MGKSGGNGYDAAYNATMAGISQDYLEMAQSAFRSWDIGGGRDLEEATARAGLALLPDQERLARGQINSMISLLPAETELSAATLGLGIKKAGNQSAIMDKFYESLGDINETSAMGEAGANMASQFANQEKSTTMGLQRRGVMPTANNVLTADKAKAIGLAGQNALNNARQQNKQELLTGLTI